MASAFLRLFYIEKVNISANINLSLSKINVELRDLLFDASNQLEQRGQVLSRMMVSKITFRK